MILAILQARVSSSRLPGKVLKPILGVPMILRQIERIKQATRIDELVIATSTDPSDDGLAEICRRAGVTCLRGSLNDVLDRYYQVALRYQPEHVVRLTGDCPLTDPEVIDVVIEAHLAEGNDYTSNTLEPTYPDGLDVEVIRFSCLKQAWEQAKLPAEREHVTLFIYSNRALFKLGSVKHETDLSDLRWTVDEQEDFWLVCSVYESLYPAKPLFSSGDVLEYVRGNEMIRRINSHHRRNEGLEKSLRINNKVEEKG